MKAQALLALSFGAVSALAREFYVNAVIGDDTYPGREHDFPVKTLGKVQQLVREYAKPTQGQDVAVHVGEGYYFLEKPMVFNDSDSGKNGKVIMWYGSNATVSGGIRLTGWSDALNMPGVFMAPVPKGTKSRNLYVNGQAANYARRMLTTNRKDFTYTARGMSWTNPAYDWLMTTPGIEKGEIRFLNSFTDRYSPIESISKNRTIVMKNNVWANNIVGWDTVNAPYNNKGTWIQGALALMTDGGQFYLDSENGYVFYKPLAGEDMRTAEAYLATQEALFIVSGTYDAPVHDIGFHGIEFKHSTWLRPNEYGYVDQQTGGYIEGNVTYPEFEASRPKWWQLPSAIQISAARDIQFSNCVFRELGGVGVGIGNDDNAHISGVGLGATGVSVINSYFTQAMGGGLVAGGIQHNAHHPDDPRMLNANLTITGNIFYNNSALFASTVPLFVTYVASSTIARNDISHAPYSGMCYGYGWGSNDAGGSGDYLNRGLYKYQPLYTTPTIARGNRINANLIHDYGFALSDLGGIYTQSRHPDTLFSDNYMYDSPFKGLYPDEGSSNMTFINNIAMSEDLWYGPNDKSPGYNTGNNTFIDNWGKYGDILDGIYDGEGDPYGNTFIRNFLAKHPNGTSSMAQRAVYRAGVLPGRRVGRPTTNDETLADGYLSIGPGERTMGRIVMVVLENYDDVVYTDVTVNVAATGQTLELVGSPITSAPPNSAAVAMYRVGGDGPVTIAATASYQNPRTKERRAWERTAQVEFK